MKNVTNYLIPWLIAIFMLLYIPVFAQEEEEPVADTTSESIDAADFSLEELLNIEVEVASLFAEDELVVGSMVSGVSSDQWNKLGARRVSDVLANELSIMIYPHFIGNNVIAIRGYATDSSNKGTAYLVDKIPMNSFVSGDIAHVANFGIGTLDRIELIKGPGSAIYGSDAFHGVVSMKTFESDKDHYSIELSGAYPLYGDGNVKISHGFLDDTVRLNMTASINGQAPLKEEYDYYYPEEMGMSGLMAAEQGSGEREPSYRCRTGVLKLNVMPSDKLKIRLGSYVYESHFTEFPGMGKARRVNEFDITASESLFVMGNGSIDYSFENKISIQVSGYHSYSDNIAKINYDKYSSVSENNAKYKRSGTNFIIKQPDNALNLQWSIGYAFSYMQTLDCPAKTINWDPAGAGEYGIFGEESSEPYSRRSRTIHSAYAQAKWGVIKETLYLLFGGRLDNYSDYGNQITPRGGLIFLPTDKSSIKALYGRSFRAATATELYGITGHTAANEDLEPETIDIFELIFMYKGKDWKTTANVFYSKWENGIISRMDYAAIMTSIATGEAPIHVYRTSNSGKSESYGGEWSIFYSFNPHAVSFGFSYIKSKTYDVEKGTPGLFGGTSDLQDEDFMAFPEYTANAGIHLTFFDVNFFLNNRLYLKMKETHLNMRDDPEALPAYFRMDLNIHKAIGENAEVTLDVRNLLNRKNYVPAVMGAKDGFEEPGISVLLRAAYKL